MSLPYEIKLSPGKGEGIFATSDLAAGVLILQDTKIMETKRNSDVVEAYNRLSLTDQMKFMQLHESKWNWPTKIGRIYYVRTCSANKTLLSSPSLSLFLSSTNVIW